MRVESRKTALQLSKCRNKITLRGRWLVGEKFNRLAILTQGPQIVLEKI